MTDTVKPTAFRTYYNAEEMEMLNAICVKTELEPGELLKKLTVAGLKAVHENGDTFPLPLRLTIIGTPEPAPRYALNEAPPKRKK